MWHPMMVVMLLVGCTANSGRATREAERGLAWPGAWTTWFGERKCVDCKELLDWMREYPEAMTVKASRAERTVEVRYVPALAAACAEQPEAVFTDVGLQGRAAQLSGGDQYVLRFRSKAGRTEDVLGLVQAEVMEVVGGDTLPCAFLHEEPAPPVVPWRTVVLGFGHHQDASDRTLVLLDKSGKLGGPWTFRFPEGSFSQFKDMTTETTLLQ
jgi:hypothetical protein